MTLKVSKFYRNIKGFVTKAEKISRSEPNEPYVLIDVKRLNVHALDIYKQPNVHARSNIR